MKIDNTPEEWALIKEKYIELYHHNKSPDWTLEKHLSIIADIDAMVKIS